MNFPRFLTICCYLINSLDNTEHSLLMKTVHTVESYKTEKSETFRLEFIFSGISCVYVNNVNKRTSTAMGIWREGKKKQNYATRPISEGPFKFLMSPALVYFIHIVQFFFNLFY